MNPSEKKLCDFGHNAWAFQIRWNWKNWYLRCWLRSPEGMGEVTTGARIGPLAIIFFQFY